jgi:hypothetical protein
MSTALSVSEGPESVPTGVFPYYPGAQCTTTNVDYWNLMYRPGYWFGLGGSILEQPSLSSFGQPTFRTSGGKTTASFTIKPWVWSNGNEPSAAMETLVAQMVGFWLNMDKAESTVRAISTQCKGLVAIEVWHHHLVQLAWAEVDVTRCKRSISASNFGGVGGSATGHTCRCCICRSQVRHRPAAR